MKKISLYILGALLGLVIVIALAYLLPRTEPAAPAAETTAAPAAGDSVSGGLYADIAIRDYGTITVRLDPSAAPATVENFTALAQEGFYDGLTFHRIIDGFMMQGGQGGQVPNVTGEFAANGHENPISHVRGVISMARASDFDSATSQFFIVQSDSTYLDGQYAAFGHVTEGMDIVDAVCADARPTDNNGSIAPADQPVIESIAIREG